MDDRTRTEYELESQTLRAELKQWEGSWATTHAGKKPSRDDIKQNPDIAQKYKSYNKVRDILSGKIPPPPLPNQAAHKRKPSSLPTAETPSKRLRTTPSIPRFQQPYDDPAGDVTPSTNRKLFSNPTPTSIGPTPQRDGRVLGLFDLLSADEATPSRPRTGDFLADPTTGTDIEPPATTPRKQTSATSHDDEHEDGESIIGRHGRTPMSSSKRQMLDNFLLYTPLKNRDNNAGGGGGGSFSARIGLPSTNTSNNDENSKIATTPKGPRSASKSLFATPAFLKRNSKPLESVDENGEYLVSPRPLRLPRKPFGRGLSSVVAGLRRLEEERLDDDLDALRELEGDMEGFGTASAAATSGKRDMKAPVPGSQEPDGATGAIGGGQDEAAVEVGDSQAPPRLLGAFDDEALYDSSDDGKQQLDRGQPLRVFKKKGQKRTTRRVNIKPTMLKRLELPEDKGEADPDVVPETQFVDGGLVDPDVGDLLSDSEFGDDGEDDVPKGKNAKGDKGGEKEGAVKKAVRKVKATAHANFKRLKLRSYGAKGGPGHGSRFGRRR